MTHLMKQLNVEKYFGFQSSRQWNTDITQSVTSNLLEKKMGKKEMFIQTLSLWHMVFQVR